MRSGEQKIKLLVLWDILQKNTDEDHALNADEIRLKLKDYGINVIRRVVAEDIAALNEYGYEVLSFKKKYYYCLPSKCDCCIGIIPTVLK